MKTNTKNQNRNSGLQNRTEQVSTGALTPREIRKRIELFEIRRANRELSRESVLSQLEAQLPEEFKQAEIVGCWIWLEIPRDKRRITFNRLWNLGFHWNKRRSVWQHPCGAFAPFAPHPGDPRKRYGSKPVTQGKENCP